MHAVHSAERRDEDVKNNPKVGDSNVKNREQSRFISVSQETAGGAVLRSLRPPKPPLLLRRG